MKNNKKTFFLSILLFVFIIATIGLPYKNWWCYGNDDFHGIYVGYKTKTLKDYFDFFHKKGNILDDIGPSNRTKSDNKKPSSFFSVYYRPLYSIYLALEYKFFKTNTYYWFLTNTLFHAINTIILFNIFLFFLSYLGALIGALFFAFHPLISYKFGDFVNLHFYINIMFLLLLFLSFKKYLDSKKLIYNFFSCMLFVLSLFTRESSIVIPPMIFFGTYLYENKNKQISIKNFLNQFFIILKKTYLFFLIAISFLCLRIFLYPINFDFLNKNLNSNKLANLLNRFGELQVLIYDSLSLSWLPWGQKLIRGIIVLSIINLLTWLFIKNAKKIYVLYFLFCSILILWPAYVGNYCSRYFYEACPFLLIAFILLFVFYKGHLYRLKNAVTYILSFYVIFLIFFNIECFSQREKNMQICSNAIQELIKHPKINKKPICILGCPGPGLGYYLASLLWVLLDNPSHTIYIDSSTMLRQPEFKTTNYKNTINKYYNKNVVQINPLENGFQFKTLNPTKISFDLPPNHYSLGDKIINEKIIESGSEKITDFTLLLEQKYIEQKPLFFTWDFEKQQFITIKLKKNKYE
ncbi:hypothetical protein GF322_01585 [Candidatus Dependentiae bacterium]|nr:hypothetical protein [Candidatus Dependentiae bacterium]